MLLPYPSRHDIRGRVCSRLVARSRDAAGRGMDSILLKQVRAAECSANSLVAGPTARLSIDRKKSRHRVVLTLDLLT